MKTGLIILAVAAAGIGLYLNAKRKASQTGLVVVKKDDGFYPQPKKVLPAAPGVQNFDVNQRSIFAGGDFRNTPMPDVINQSFVRS